MFPWFPFFQHRSNQRKHRRIRHREEMVEVHTVFADAHHMPMPTTSTAMIKNSNQQQQQQQLEVICKFAPLAAMKFQRENNSSQQQPSSSTTTFAPNMKSQPSDADPSGEEEEEEPSSQTKPEAQTSSEPAEKKRTENMQINFDGHEVIRREEKPSPPAPVIRVRQGIPENLDGKEMPSLSSSDELRSIEPDDKTDEEEHSLFPKATTSDVKLLQQNDANPEEETTGEKQLNRNLVKNEVEIDEKQSQKPSANIEELHSIGDAKKVSPPPLLPKASSENLRVEFGDQEDAPENDDNSTMAKAEKLELLSGVGGRICSANASTSSSSGQLSAAAASSALPPRSNSSSGKSSTALATKKRGTSGSRSGTSSAKQSPRPTHRLSTDSIANALKQSAEKVAAPVVPSSPPPPRRRSAFETSQAMRELFGGGGGAVESPFAGLENKSQNRRRLRRLGGDNDGDEQQKEEEQKRDEKERDQVEEPTGKCADVTEISTTSKAIANTDLKDAIPAQCSAQSLVTTNVVGQEVVVNDSSPASSASISLPANAIAAAAAEVSSGIDERRIGVGQEDEIPPPAPSTMSTRDGEEAVLESNEGSTRRWQQQQQPEEIMQEIIGGQLAAEKRTPKAESKTEEIEKILEKVEDEKMQKNQLDDEHLLARNQVGEEQMTEKTAAAELPAQQQHQMRNAGRPKSVARVAPFAYFPSSEEPEATVAAAEAAVTTVSAEFGGRRLISTSTSTHQDVVAFSAVATELSKPIYDNEVLKAQPEEFKEEIGPWEVEKEEESIEQSHNHAEPNKEENRHQKAEKSVHWAEEDSRRAKQLPNGTAGEYPPIPNLGSAGPPSQTIGQHQQQHHQLNGHQQQKAKALPGDSQRRQIKNGDSPAASASAAVPLQSTQIQRQEGQKEPVKQQQTGNGTLTNGNGRNNNHNNSGNASGSSGGSGSGTSGGGGGGGGAGPPPSSLEPMRMVNDAGANGTTGAAANGNGGGPQLLIRNATIVNDDDIFMADVLIEGGTIREISAEPIKLTADQQSCEQIDAAGKCLLPAGIDLNTKLPAGPEALTRATKAALCGGTGTIMNIMTIEETTTDVLAALDQIRGQISTAAECNVAICVAIKKWRSEQSRQEMTRLVERGVNNFLLNFTSDTELFEALDHARALGSLCRLIPGNPQMMAIVERKQQNQRNSSQIASVEEKLEVQSVQQLSSLAELANAPICFQSIKTVAAVRALQEVKCAGRAPIGAEVPVEAVCGGMAVEAVQELLASQPNCVCVSGNRIQQQGMEMIEKRMSTLWDRAVLAGRRLDPMRFVAVTSANAARLLNLYPRKGRVAVGSDADLALLDLPTPLSSSSSASSCARLQLVLLGGQIRYRHGNFVALASESPKMGSRALKPSMFLPLTPNSPHLFGIVRIREGNFNFADFAINRQQLRSAESTRTGTPDEPVAASSAGVQPRNRNAQTDQPASRATTKVIHPPGGKTSVLW